MTLHLGVDLGSTWTRAAVCRDGWSVPLTLPRSGGDRDDALQDAVMSTVAPGPDGVPVVGSPPGPDVVDDVVLRLGDPTPVVLGGTAVPAVDLMAALLGPVARAAQEWAPVRDGTVLVVPAVWGAHRRDTARAAASAAGLGAVRVVSSIEAVAVRYRKQVGLGEGGLLGVYDWGGRTFGCGVALQAGETPVVLGRAGGIDRLGGHDLDVALLRHLAARVARGRGPDVVVDLGNLRRCRRVREVLSHRPVESMQLRVGSGHRQVEVTRAELDGVVRAPLESTLDALERSLASAGVAAQELDALVLVGGVVSTPLVRAVLGERLGCAVSVAERPALENVLGAASWGADHRAGSGRTVVAGSSARGAREAGPPAAAGSAGNPGRPDAARVTSGGRVHARPRRGAVAAGALLLAVVVVVVAVALALLLPVDRDLTPSAGSGPAPAAPGAPPSSSPPPGTPATPAPELLFATSFEDVDLTTLENERVSSSGVTGFCCDYEGMETKAGTAEESGERSGPGLLLYSGTTTGRARAVATNEIVRIPVPVDVGERTTLSWWIWPEPGQDWVSTSVGLDLRFTDGSTLADSDPGPRTPQGAGARPVDMPGLVRPGVWQRVEVDLGAFASGRQIEALLLTVDSDVQRADFRGFVDDVEIRG